MRLDQQIAREPQQAWPEPPHVEHRPSREPLHDQEGAAKDRRVRARDRNILVPDFVHILNYDRIREFMARVPPPWLLKPRSEASSLGIKKINAPDELWPALDVLGDRQSYYVLEKFVPGEVFHVDSIVSEKEVVFAEVHGYARPPFDVMHGGGIFVTRTLPREAEEAQVLRALNQQLLEAQLDDGGVDGLVAPHTRIRVHRGARVVCFRRKLRSPDCRGDGGDRVRGGDPGHRTRIAAFEAPWRIHSAKLPLMSHREKRLLIY